MRNFHFTSKPSTTFVVDFGDDNLRRLSRIHEMHPLDVFQVVNTKCVRLLEAAFGGKANSSSEEKVVQDLNAFLYRCLSKGHDFSALGEVFTFVNLNTGASLTLVPLHRHDFDGFASSIKEILE